MMKRKVLLIGATLFLAALACNVPAMSNPGTVQPTSQSSAGELVAAMNLTAADVPGYETAKTNDIVWDQVLNQNVVAYDYAAYADAQENTYVNSIVMELSKAPDAQVIDDIFKQARQNKQFIICRLTSSESLGEYSGEIPLSLGDSGKIRFIDTASGKVYVAVVARGSYVTVITTCGPDADQQLVSLLAAMVDTRVVSLSSGGPLLSGGNLTPYPPPPTEAVTPQPTEGGYPPPGTPLVETPTFVPGTPEVAVDCAALGLTQEECANAGTNGHDYILVDIVSWVDGKKQDTKTLNVLVRFSWPFPDPMVHQQKQCLIWNKTQQNTYECVASGRKNYTITFTKEGFLMIQEWRDPEVGVVLKSQTTYVFAP
jgi:hypothetical protein